MLYIKIFQSAIFTSLKDAPVIYASDSEEEEQFFSFTEQPTYKSVDQTDEYEAGRISESEETNLSEDENLEFVEDLEDQAPKGVDQWRIASVLVKKIFIFS